MKLPNTFNDAVKLLLEDLKGEEFSNTLNRFYSKDKAYAPLVYYIQQAPLKDLTGETDKVYENYFFAIDETFCDIATKNLFTRTLKEFNIFIKTTLDDNGQRIRAYYKADYCPTCEQSLPQ